MGESIHASQLKKAKSKSGGSSQIWLRLGQSSSSNPDRGQTYGENPSDLDIRDYRLAELPAPENHEVIKSSTITAQSDPV